MYGKDIFRTIAMIAVVLIVARFYNNYKNEEKVAFFKEAEKIIIYDISYEKTEKMDEKTLETHKKVIVDDVSKVIKSAVYEKATIDTSESNYGLIFCKDGKVLKARFINFTTAFVLVDDVNSVYKYNLFSKDIESLVDIKSN